MRAGVSLAVLFMFECLRWVRRPGAAVELRATLKTFFMSKKGHLHSFKAYTTVLWSDDAKSASLKSVSRVNQRIVIRRVQRGDRGGMDSCGI